MGFPRVEEIANITTLQSISHRETSRLKRVRELEEEEEEEEVPNGKKPLLC